LTCSVYKAPETLGQTHVLHLKLHARIVCQLSTYAAPLLPSSLSYYPILLLFLFLRTVHGIALGSLPVR
jgi:hypothetical protein